MNLLQAVETGLTTEETQHPGEQVFAIDRHGGTLCNPSGYSLYFGTSSTVAVPYDVSNYRNPNSKPIWEYVKLGFWVVGEGRIKKGQSCWD